MFIINYIGMLFCWFFAIFMVPIGLLLIHHQDLSNQANKKLHVATYFHIRPEGRAELYKTKGIFMKTKALLIFLIEFSGCIQSSPPSKNKSVSY
jgi:hypothetical protein